jgi:tetratricopeptide (TPR) repeat protein
LLASVCLADNAPTVTLDTNEALFDVLAAINSCGYDSELSISHPLRQQIREEVTKAVEASPDATTSQQVLCGFFNQHQQSNESKKLSQYVSMALYLNPPPELTLKTKEAEAPPDAVGVIGMVPLLQKFQKDAGLHAIWQRHAQEYSTLADRYHAPVAKMLFDSEIYLKLPSSGYLGRRFTVYFDPMGAPGQINARNYGPDYYVVLSPGASSELKMEQIRHTYLHYLIDPLVLKYPSSLKRLEPLLAAAKSAPMDDSFKGDISLLVTESFIRAVEAHTVGNAKTPLAEREQAVAASEAQGFILTRYFYDALTGFEKDEAGLRSVYSDMLSHIDVSKENKRAGTIKFAAKADPEVLTLAKAAPSKILQNAEQHLVDGDREGAQKLAQQALDEKSGDSGRALFILAQVAAAGSNMDGARTYFEQALQVAQEPRVVAWSHIYLGRIFDIKEERDEAVVHYRAALTSGASLPGVKDAAERGLQQAYEPPRPQEQQQQ